MNNFSFEDRLIGRLDRLESAGLRRNFNPLQSSMGPVVVRRKKEFINFSSNDYLGMACHPEVLARFRDEANSEGVGSGGSRLVCGDRQEIHRLEQDLADWKQREVAFLFGSGYLTSLGVIQAVASDDDLVLLDELSHRCLIEGARLSGAEVAWFHHNDLTELEQMLDERRRNHEAVLVVTEGIFSMDGDRAPLKAIRSLTREFDAWMFVDEAHSAGVTGPEGAGRTPDLEDPPELTMGTLSKAVGTYGGYVAGDRPLKEFLTNRATTAIYSTAPPPAIAAASRTSLNIIRRDRERRKELHKNIERVARFLTERELPCPDPPSQIVPLLTGETEPTLEASGILQQSGIDAIPIRYPTVPRSKGRIRISLRSDHTPDHLNRLLKGISRLDEKGLLVR